MAVECPTHKKIVRCHRHSLEIPKRNRSLAPPPTNMKSQSNEQLRPCQSLKTLPMCPFQKIDHTSSETRTLRLRLTRPQRTSRLALTHNTISLQLMELIPRRKLRGRRNIRRLRRPLLRVQARHHMSVLMLLIRLLKLWRHQRRRGANGVRSTLPGVLLRLREVW